MPMRDFRKPNQGESRPKPKILGANEITDAQPEIRDRNTRQEKAETEIETRVHTEEISESDQVRPPQKQPGDPEVRIRTADREAWEAVKRLDDQ